MPQPIERLLRKVAQKFPAGTDPVQTDIHLTLNPATGALVATDDNEQELANTAVEQWRTDASQAPDQIRQAISNLRYEVIERMAVARPFTFVLNDEELYLVDEDDTVILTAPLLADLEEDLDAFLAKLMS